MAAGQGINSWGARGGGRKRELGRYRIKGQGAGGCRERGGGGGINSEKQELVCCSRGCGEQMCNVSSRLPSLRTQPTSSPACEPFSSLYHLVPGEKRRSLPYSPQGPLGPRVVRQSSSPPCSYSAASPARPSRQPAPGPVVPVLIES